MDFNFGTNGTPQFPDLDNIMLLLSKFPKGG